MRLDRGHGRGELVVADVFFVPLAKHPGIAPTPTAHPTARSPDRHGEGRHAVRRREWRRRADSRRELFSRPFAPNGRVHNVSGPHLRIRAKLARSSNEQSSDGINQGRDLGVLRRGTVEVEQVGGLYVKYAPGKIDQLLMPGDSGSSCFDANGRIVGVHSRGNSVDSNSAVRGDLLDAWVSTIVP